MIDLEEPNEPYGIRPGPGRKHPDDDGRPNPSCVNCRQVRNCIIAKAVRDFKGHVQTIGLHCMDWEGEHDA